MNWRQSVIDQSIDHSFIDLHVVYCQTCAVAAICVRDWWGNRTVVEAPTAGGRLWWVWGRGSLPPVKGVRGWNPGKIFEFTDAESCILVHFYIKNYLLPTHQRSRKDKYLLQRTEHSSSDTALNLEPKTWGMEAHPSPHGRTQINGAVCPSCIPRNRRTCTCVNTSDILLRKTVWTKSQSTQMGPSYYTAMWVVTQVRNKIILLLKYIMLKDKKEFNFKGYSINSRWQACLRLVVILLRGCWSLAI